VAIRSFVDVHRDFWEVEQVGVTEIHALAIRAIDNVDEDARPVLFVVLHSSANVLINVVPYSMVYSVP